jgi:hypothetical protein
MKQILRTIRRSFNSCLAIPAIVLVFSATCLAQSTGPKPIPSPRPIDGMSADKSSNTEDRVPLTTFEEEMRAKRNIRLAEKEHEDNLKRARELSQLAKDLQQVISTKQVLSRDDNKKIERLEKLTKKIRGEAGGEDEDVNIIDKPTDLPSTVAKIGEMADALSKNVQNTPRQVVSASVIGNANVLLELIKILRTLTRTSAN